MTQANPTLEIFGRSLKPNYSGGSLDRFEVDAAIFGEICSYWGDLSLDDLPLLKSLKIDPLSRGGFEVSAWVARRGIARVFCLTAQYPDQSKLPNLSEIWPQLRVLEEASYFDLGTRTLGAGEGRVNWVNT